jgi:hypothetical protein
LIVDTLTLIYINIDLNMKKAKLLGKGLMSVILFSALT